MAAVGTMLTQKYFGPRSGLKKKLAWDPPLAFVILLLGPVQHWSLIFDYAVLILNLNILVCMQTRD
jgi:hypothetical protein